MKEWIKKEYIILGIIFPIIVYIITEMIGGEKVIIIQQQSANLEPQPEPVVPLKFKINYLYRHKYEFEFKPLTNTATLKNGDLYKIIFTPLENSYVYIFHTDSKSNKLIQIFPMHKFKGLELNHSNPVIAETTYHIPKKGISFTLDNNSGTTESIYFIAAREPDIELEQLYKEIKIAQKHDKIIQTKLETSKILQKITQNKTITEKEYMVEQTTASEFVEICEKCIKVLSFRHE